MSLAGASLLIGDDWNAAENFESKYYDDRCAGKNVTGCLGFRTQGEEGEWKKNIQRRIEKIIHSHW